MTELDIARKKIEEVINGATLELNRTRSAGGTPIIPAFDKLLGRLIREASHDPRISKVDLENITKSAKTAYETLSRAFGYSGTVADPTKLRGLVIHLAVQVDDGGVEVTPYADEAYAVGVVNGWLKDKGVETTVQQIRVWEGAQEKEGEHPLHGTKFMGSGVRSCPIR